MFRGILCNARKGLMKNRHLKSLQSQIQSGRSSYHQYLILWDEIIRITFLVCWLHNILNVRGQLLLRVLLLNILYHRGDNHRRILLCSCNAPYRMDGISSLRWRRIESRNKCRLWLRIAAFHSSDIFPAPTFITIQQAFQFLWMMCRKRGVSYFHHG